MPYRRRRTRRRRRRRPYRKRPKKNTRPSILTVTGLGNIMPDKLRCKLKYTVRQHHNFASIVGNYIFNANSLHDPDRTGVGHQPMGFDQLKAMYNRYKVYACSYKATISSPNTPLWVAAGFKNGSAPFASVEENDESAHSKSVLVSDGGQNQRTLKDYIGMKKLYGRTHLSDADGAVVSTSPTEVAVIGFNYEASNGATNITGVSVVYEIVYYAEFSDLYAMSGS